jgi:large subunit ribosomal protein L24
MATKRFAPKFHLKKGDKVKVLAGDDKGKTGVILSVIVKQERAIVEGLNLVTKHRKPTQTSAGEIVKMEAPIHISNLAVVDPKSGDATRIGRRLENGKSVRYSKKSGQTIQ